MLGNLADMSKVHSEYKAYLAQIVEDKTEGIRAKNLIVSLLTPLGRFFDVHVT